MFACLKITSHKKVQVKQLKAAKDFYELTKKQSTSTCKTIKKRVRFVDSEPTILGEENTIYEKRRCINDEKEGIRVTIRLTKEQAAELLSRCNDGSVLQLKDVARELLSIPGDRVSIVSTRTDPISS